MKYNPQPISRIISDTWQNTINKLVKAIEDEFRRVSNMQEGDDRIVTTDDVIPHRYINGGGLPASYYYAGIDNAVALTTGAPSANVLRAIPFIASSKGGVIDLLAFRVTTLLAGNGRIGLYASITNKNIYPGKLIIDSGDISVGSNGVKTFACSANVDAGQIYWLVYLSSVAAILRCSDVANSTVPSILPDDNSMPTTRSIGLSSAFAYAALPADFPASAAYVTAGPLPVLAYRYGQ